MKNIFTFLLLFLAITGLFGQTPGTLSVCEVKISFVANKTNPVTYSFKTDPMTDGSKYNWNFSDGQVSDNSNPTKSFKANGSYVVYVKVSKNDQDCIGRLAFNYEAGTPTPIILSGKGKVKKLATNDACGLQITLDNGSVIVPKEVVPAFEFRDGQYVELAYELFQDKPSGCPAGIYTKINRIAEIQVVNTCKIPILIEKKNTVPVSYSFKTENQATTSKFIWTFGDGAKSDMINPDHAFKTTDSYLINLKVYDPASGKVCYGELKANFDGETTAPPISVIVYAKGKVIKSTSADCGLVLALENKTLVPLEWGMNYTLAEGKYVEFAYEVLKDKTSDCGTPVKIHKISEIITVIPCKTPISFVKNDKPGTYTFSTEQKPAASKFYWYFGDGGSSNEISPVYTFKKSGNWVINLKVIDAAGKVCYGETKGKFDGETNPSFAGRGKIKKLTTAGCEFVITSDNVAFIPTNLPAGFILKDGMYVEFTYEKMVNKITNCTEGAEIKILTIKEIVITPNCNFDIVAKSVEATPNTFKFTIVGLTIAEIKACKWNFGDGTTGATTKDPEHKFVKTGTFEVSCAIVTVSGCTITRTIKKTVLMPPVTTCKGAISLTLFDPIDNTCNGSAVVKLMNGDNEMANVTYLWSNGQKGNTAKELCPDKSYTVQVSIEGVCQKSTSFTMLSKPMFKASTLNGLSNFAVTDPKEGVDYEWSIGNGLNLKGAEINVDFQTDGVFDVTLKAVSGSNVSETSQQIVVMKSATGTEIINKSILNIFPNPAKEQLNINFGKPVSGNLFIEIMNLAGQRAYSQQLKANGLDHTAVNLKQLKAGIYFIRITNGKQVIADRKFIKAD